MIGLLVALFVVGFGDAFFMSWGAVAVGMAVLGFLFPAPFLVIGEILGHMIGSFTP